MINLVAKYDEIYRNKPTKWTSDERDYFAYTCLNIYLDKPPERLMDIGCGNGHTIAYLSKRWQETRYTGIDISPVALELAREKVPDANWKESWVWNDYTDVLIMMGVAEHFPDFGDLAMRIKRAIHPDGILYLEVPNNLAISGRTEEGWYPSSHQDEWHLRRKTWERKFKDEGLYVQKSIVGPSAYCEYVWILKG